MATKNLEEAVKEKITPLLEETMEKSWGITIPKIEEDIADRLLKPQLHVYIASNTTFKKAKQFFKKEFIKNELKLHQGNISHLAKMLRIDRRSVHRAIKDLEINVEELRQQQISPEEWQEEFVDQTIRTTLDRYKEIIQPQKMEQMYGQLSHLSRNIAKVLPHQELTWKEAENEFEKQFITHALEENRKEISQTAKKIEIRVETLYRKIKKLGIR
ncbi:MAG TPA: helix-turn-helix domain-containing protein [Candidatus Nanoarchaeia archaeon]|nr:helix-turn-helix domain-containing protein [Candidatus Nanoarchaeia archaeon]